jgi:hypothetical protein
MKVCRNRVRPHFEFRCCSSRDSARRGPFARVQPSPELMNRAQKNAR